MRIAILGTGHVGGILGSRWAKAGHEVVFGSRDPHSDKVEALLHKSGANARAMSLPEAASASDTILLAVHWNGVQQMIESLGDLSGKTLIDCINPLNVTFDGLELGYTTSAAEQIAEWAKNARVVKAFNTISSATMANPVYGDQHATMFYCGDDSDAKKIVHQLSLDLGLDPVDAGPLTLARSLEPLAMLYILLAIKEGWGSNCAFKIMRR